MKTIFFIFAIATSVLAQGNTTQKNREVLVDFRKDRPASAVKISAAMQRNILSKVFRRYLTDQDKCRSGFDGGENDYLAAARKAGQIVPSINDITTGSFTAVGQTQTAYVISVSECNASHADNFGTKRVAIFSGQQLVADVDADFMSSIVRKTDLDGNGINELLMTSGDMSMGTLTEMATLTSFENGRRHVIQDFGTVVEDSCASEVPGSESRASVLYAPAFVPGLKPTIMQENYRTACRNPRRWRFVSKGKMQE